MGYIPENAEWYLAELLMEITVHGARCKAFLSLMLFTNLLQTARSCALKSDWEFRSPKSNA